ncbi:hypothetical protein [Synoicihabitans lomoniglobus]|uniref:Uncharacterized protein n=1 Tax=Synoicihabitans lomoniglobus TaxID=2909285 RepID=A0AAF0CND0_9BACT|nr:hypothetical protein [Opitutaceae bacterium LMO-M01]WED64280.1 hypothetical protein PXH66_18235 [Opitutaceae bacterium LMO-M01]
MPYESLDRDRLTQALQRLGQLAVGEGIELELSIYGGAVFTLVYGSRDSTKDVDALIRPVEVGHRLARQVAREQELPDDWINGDVALFLAKREAKRPLSGVSFGPGLIVTVPTAAYLLALKLRACRPALPGYPGDEPDIQFLIGKMKPASLTEVESIFARFFPQDVLTDTAVEIVEAALREVT